MAFALLLSVFVIATCGLIYELIAGTIASYLLGDSVTQFSTVIGVYLFSMGIGSFLSRYIVRNLVSVFVQVELLIGIVGGCSAALLFMAFEFVESFQVLLYGLVTLTGILVGLEIPLLMRILKAHFEFRDLVSKVFTFDYVGALLASLLFPLLLVPHLGLIRSSFLFGILNVIVALWAISLFKTHIPANKPLQVSGMAILVGLTMGFAYSDQLMNTAEATTYADRIVYAKSSPYQRIVLTKSADELRLFLNGNLQFSSRDEYRYHEALVHVGLGSLKSPKEVLVLGGGDGLAIREILKYPSVEKITLVDLDAAVTKLFSRQPALSKLNQQAFTSPKVQLVSADAMVWLRKNTRQYDFIVIDFPDPGNFSVGKLYTDTFYKTVKQALKPDGAMVVQSTSPFYAPKSFWCVVNTLDSVGLSTLPYHAYVPSFGDWGYILASHKAFLPVPEYPKGLKFVTPEMLPAMLTFPPDMRADTRAVNRLNNQVLVHTFESEWSRYVQEH